MVRPRVDFHDRHTFMRCVFYDADMIASLTLFRTTCSGIGVVLDGSKIVNADSNSALHTYKEDGKRLFKGDLILEIDGKDVRQENEHTLQSMLFGIIGSEVTVKVKRAESEDIVSVSIIRGVRALGMPRDEQNLSDLTTEVKGVAEALYRELGLLREANGQLTEEISKARAVRGDYVK